MPLYPSAPLLSPPNSLEPASSANDADVSLDFGVFNGEVTHPGNALVLHYVASQMATHHIFTWPCRYDLSSIGCSLLRANFTVGGRTTYSNWCSRLAAEGYVVIAIEHRDGSGPAVRIRTSGNDKTRVLLYTKVDEVQ